MVKKDDVKCWNCDEVPDRPVTVDCEPEPDIWCLDCAMNNGVGFSTPVSSSSRSDIEDAMRAWCCDYEEAYDRLEDGECFEDEIDWH